MTVAELIEKLHELPADYEVGVGSGSLIAIWVNAAAGRIDLDYSNSWYQLDGYDPDFVKHWDAHPGVVIEG